MFRFGLGLYIFLILFLMVGIANAKTVTVTTRGSCAIVGVTAEQAMYLAKQRARSAAIEQAAGVQISSSSLVTSGRLAANFIKTFSRGFIVKEKVRWLPLASYQKNSSTPPIPEYGIELTATVFIPEKRKTSLGLEAELNQTIFRSGEKAVLTVRTRHTAHIAIFNLTADGKVVMLFPNEYEELATPGNRGGIRLPEPNSGLELVMVNLPDHTQDAEGFFIAALGKDATSGWLDYFEPGRYMELNEFFAQYSKVAEQSEDLVLPYEIFAGAK